MKSGDFFMHQNRKFFLLIITALAFAGSFVAAKYAVAELPPLATAFIRYFIASLFLTALIKKYGGAGLKIDIKDFPLFFIAGFFSIVCYHYLFFVSLNYTAVANTSIINAFNPILMAVAAAAVIKERLSVKNYLGVIAAFLGVVILLSKGNINNVLALSFNKGDMLMCGATISIVFSSLSIKTLSKKYSSFAITFHSFIIGTVILFFLALTENPLPQIAAMSMRAWLSIIYMGVIASGVGLLFYNMGIKEFGPTKTSSLVNSITPVVTAALAWVFFGEQITPSIVFSLIFIIAGLRFIVR